MRLRWNHWTATAALMAQLAVPAAMAEQGRTGILTDRLTAKQLKIWKSIESVVLADDGKGYPLYPGLKSLWQRAEASGRMIFIELEDRKREASPFAGEVLIEKSDAMFSPDRLVVRLRLWLIDRSVGSMTYQGGAVRQAEIHSFRGLDRYQRYAQVLGHELIHALFLLTDSSQVRMLEELKMETQAFYKYRRLNANGSGDEVAQQNLVERIKALRTALEGPAEKLDAELYRELLSRQGGRPYKNRLEGTVAILTGSNLKLPR